MPQQLYLKYHTINFTIFWATLNHVNRTSVCLSLYGNTWLYFGCSVILKIKISAIWNFIDIGTMSISMNWIEYTPVSVYEYDVCDPNGTNVDNGNEVADAVLIQVFPKY